MNYSSLWSFKRCISTVDFSKFLIIEMQLLVLNVFTCSCCVLSLLYYFFLYWGECQSYVLAFSSLLWLQSVLLCLAMYTYVVPELNSINVSTYFNSTKIAKPVNF